MRQRKNECSKQEHAKHIACALQAVQAPSTAVVFRKHRLVVAGEQQARWCSAYSFSALDVFLGSSTE